MCYDIYVNRTNNGMKKKTVQDMKVEIEPIKKNQSEGIVEVKNLRISKANFINRIKEMEDIKDKIKEMDILVKENLKSKMSRHKTSRQS